MAIDTSIYQNIQQPQPSNQLASLAQAYQIRGLQAGIDKSDRDEARQNRLLSVLQSPEFQAADTVNRQNLVYGAGDIEGATKIGTAAAAANKDTRSAAQTDLEMALKRHDAASGAFMQLAKDPSQAPQMIGQLVQAGILTPDYGQKVLAGAAQAPNASQFFQQGAQASISAKDQIAQQIQQQGQQVTMRGQDMTQSTALRGQDLTRQSSIEARDVTKRGQDLTNQRALDAQAGGGKLTEDQGKATGWLVQAENAFNNMKTVGMDENGNPTSASKPGINDAIGALPFMGGIANSMRGADRQKFMQATSSLSEALLRAATGAGVNKDEAAQKIQELTPQFGEDAETTKQKYAAIPLYIESLKVRAGPGAAKAQTVLSNQANATQQPAGGLVSVTDAASYAKVPKGAQYTTPDGKVRVKQ